MTLKPLPIADEKLGLLLLKRLLRQRSLLVALEMMHQHIGDAFQITLPGFQPALLVGPEMNRAVLVSERDRFLWRNEKDPVTKLLRRGLLVQDGEAHRNLRAVIEPLLQRPSLLPHLPAMIRLTDELTAQWPDNGVVDMLVEMRRLALLILMDAAFGVDMWPDLQRMWTPILKAIQYISPGLWILWPALPQVGYARALALLDQYLFGLIAQRKAQIERGREAHASNSYSPKNLLDALILAGFDDDLIRDQLLTLLIAGHDTSTASLTWTLYLLAQHPTYMAQAQAEVDVVLENQDEITADHLNHLLFLDMAFKEALRLYPPIHVGSRLAATDLAVAGYEIKAGTRVMYSIYLAHRDGKHWENPETFCPHRFERPSGEGPPGERPSGQQPPGQRPPGQRPPFTYVPFGGGPRNCIGAAFAKIEARLVLARILQKFDLTLVPGQKIRPHMGATLAPAPGVKMVVRKRQ